MALAGVGENQFVSQELNGLKGLLPICNECNRIRDEQAKWWPLEAYISKKTEADFTHIICLDCKEIFYGDL
ncbi:hypothetical protein [Desulfospira joergensenii]|uniref:hypothetical protein n=1 Tax=Desulfospira joergensenii TaxID=53329 RepID=UPI0003B32489|nr:hypothetical protein [Desulfospira joergensenii]